MDDAIRTDIGQSDNWKTIMNVLSALKQNDPENFELCLNYPKKFCRKEIEKNLNDQGYQLNEVEPEKQEISDGKQEISDEPISPMERYAKEPLLEVHTNSMEEPVKIIGDEKKECEPKRIYYDDESNKVFEIVVKDGQNKVGKKIQPPKRRPFQMRFHCDDDTKVLWKIREGFDLTKEVTSVFLDCQVVDNEKKWMENLMKCGEFCTKNKKTPSSTSKDKEEKKLGQWLSMQRAVLNGKGTYKMTDERRKLLEEHLPEWFHYDQEKEWTENLMKCVEFYTKNKKTPSYSSKDKEEKKLGKWLSTQRAALNGKGNRNKMTDERRKLLEEHLPEWFHYDQEKEWMGNLMKCVEFYTKNKKTPSSTPKDKEEKKIGQWLNKQRLALNGKGNGNKMTDERRKLLEEHLPEWFHYDQEKEQEKEWTENLMKCGEFCTKNKKTPSDSSKDKEEKKLGQWLSKQRAALNGKGNRNKMTDERRKLLEEHLPEWFHKKSKTQKSSSSNSTSHSSSPSRTPLSPRPRSYLRPLPNPKEEKSTQSNFNPPHLSELSIYHKKFKTLHSSTYFSRMQSNPEEFKHYHQLSKEAEKNDNPEDLPLHIIAGYIEQFPSNLQIADLGCGDATLSTLCPQHQFTNFDVYALNKRVQVSDISKLPENLTGKFDIVVLSRAMWATNNVEILQEANRILKFNGSLIVCEPYRRWNKTEDENQLESILKSEGFIINHEERNKIENGCYHKFMYYICFKKFQMLRSNVKESKREVEAIPLNDSEEIQSIKSIEIPVPVSNNRSTNVRLTQSVLLSMEESRDETSDYRSSQKVSSEQIETMSMISSSTSGRSRKKIVKEVSEEDKQKVISSINWKNLERSRNPKNRKDVYSIDELKKLCDELGIYYLSKDNKEKLVDKIEICKN